MQVSSRSCASIDETLMETNAMGEGDEVFISIGSGATRPDVPPVQDDATTAAPEASVPSMDILDAEIVLDASGTHSVSWPLVGMDCPDCASKATRALGHLEQVSSTVVSPTSGEVKVDVDLSVGSVAEVARVLRSLGHAPDVGHQVLKGVSARELAARHGIPVARVDRLLRRQPGVLDAEVTRDDRVLVQLVPEAPSGLVADRDAALNQVLGRPAVFGVTSSERLRPDQRRLVGGTVATLLLPVVLVLEAAGAGHVLVALVSLLGVAAGGAEMVMEAVAGLRQRQVGFQVLTSLAVIGAAILGMWEEALIVVILVAFTQHLEGDALVRAREAMQGGLDRLPRTARRSTAPPKRIGNGIRLTLASTSTSLLTHHAAPTSEWEEVPIDVVRVGDRLQIRSGELIPTDGRIVSGRGSLDTAPLTGESVPVDVDVGDELSAGLVLHRGPVEVEVTATGDDTRLAGLIEAVHTFREEPPRLQGAIERFTAIWVPLVLFGSIAIWWFVDRSDWKLMLLLWVVACPCALLLAAPVPHAAVLARAAHLGAIVTGGHAMERMAQVDHVLLDKTGTLTSGRPTVGDVVVGKGKRRDAVLRLVGGLEAGSSHPYALAVQDLLAAEGVTPTAVTNLRDVNAGVVGRYRGDDVGLHRPDALPDGVVLDDRLAEGLRQATAFGHGVSVLCRGEEAHAFLTFIHDDGREGADGLVQALYRQGVNVEILSGDLQSAVDAFALKVGMPNGAAHGGLSPEQKVRFVEERGQTHVTMMVGDGFNDAGALAKADVGVAVGTGEQVNLDAADVLIPGDDPRMVSTLVKMARSAQRTLAFNLMFSIGITVVLVFAVINGWYDQLWVGVLVHEMSVIVVILNGARLAGADGWLDLLRGTFRALLDDVRVSLKLVAARWTS